MKKRQGPQIEEQLEMIEKRLANAEEYLARNVNVEGISFLHLDDWQGKSGHPMWLRNKMIPTLIQGRARKEKALETIGKRIKEKRRQARSQAGTSRLE